MTIGPIIFIRGMKADIYEGGHRIPYLCRWPGQIAAGSVSDQLVSTTDFLATVAGIIEKELPVGAGPDSYDLSEVMLGTSPAGSRDHMIQHSLDGLFAIREGDWKYTPVLGSGGFTSPKLIEQEPSEPNGALYNLSSDIGETINLISDEAETVARLHGRLEEVTGLEF